MIEDLKIFKNLLWYNEDMPWWGAALERVLVMFPVRLAIKTSLIDKSNANHVFRSASKGERQSSKRKDGGALRRTHGRI